MKICPCGIAAADCTYHAPVPETQRAGADDGADWAVPLSVYDPAGASSGAGVSTPHLNPAPRVWAPPWANPKRPVAPSWKTTPGADGTHVDDVLCKCGAYCIKRKTAYVDAQAVAHCEMLCN